MVERERLNQLWESATLKAQLPDDLKQDFFNAEDGGSLCFGSRRAFHRYFLRGKAIVIRGDVLLGTYTKDVSREGLAFYSPVSLSIEEHVKVVVPAKELCVEITRCHEIEPACFDCGAKFVR